MYTRNTNGRYHPEAACRVNRETLVPGYRMRYGNRLSRVWVLRAIIASMWKYSAGD